MKPGYCAATKNCASSGKLECAYKNVAGGLAGCMAKHCANVPGCAFVSVNKKDGTGECSPHSAAKCNFNALKGKAPWYTMEAPRWILAGPSEHTLSLSLSLS